MLKNSLFLALLVALSESVLAQSQPSAGSQIQQIPPSPIPQKAPPKILIEPGNAQVIAPSAQVKILVNSLRVTGARLLPEASLIAVTGFRAGSELTLADLRDMAAKIVTYYRQQGYSATQAYLPPQDTKNGTVTIAVIEGQHGRVILRNSSDLSFSLVNGLLDGLVKTRVESGSAAVIAAPSQLKILVNSLRVTGATVLPETTLIAVTGFRAGSELTLVDLRGMAAKIANYYHGQGYFVTQAYLPAQDTKDGTVTIAVIEGHYGEISLRNSSRLSNPVAHRLLAGLDSGDVVAIAPLERRLLLLSDVPGVSVKSTLAPGTATGTSDLIVDVTPGPLLSGSVDADNEGSRYTGEYRVGATVNINNPSGYGDVLTLRALTSGAELAYGRAAYQAQLGKAKAGVAYAALDYRLGREFSRLQANGTAQIASVYGSYPLIRSRSNNLYVQTNFDAKTFRDKVDATTTVTDKEAQVWTANLNGDYRDALGGGGISSYSLAWTFGTIDIQSPEARTADAMTARSNGDYNKLGFAAARLQSVSNVVSLYAAVSGQLAMNNLDISEKMALGGANAVRAYPVGEAYADQGYVLNLEARMPLPSWSDYLPGQMQFIGFVDAGAATLNKNRYATGTNNRTLSGAGVGLNWSGGSSYFVKSYLAYKLGDEMATSAPDSASRFWLQLVKYF